MTNKRQPLLAQILLLEAMLAVMEQKDPRLNEAYEQRVRFLTEAIEQRERQLVILSQVAARVHGEDDERVIFNVALEEILGRLGLTAAWIFTGDEQERRLGLTAWRGIAEAYLDEVRREGLGECLCPEVFWTGHRMQARNTTQCPRMPDIVEGLRAPTAHACIPLKFEDTTKGVLNVAARPGQLFSEDELRFLETLGHQIGIAVERARHRKAETLRNQEARAMAAISKAVGTSLDAASVLRAVGETAEQLLGAERVVVFLGDDPTRLRVAHLSGLPHPELRPGQVLDAAARGAHLQVRAVRERTAFSVDDWRADPRVNHQLAEQWDAGSGMVVPMVSRDRVVGLIVLTRRQASRWTEEQIDVAEAFAAQAAVALENARLYEEAREAYRELKQAQERIIQHEKMAVLGTFASGLAHEVRNPLNSITLQLSILERRIARLEPGMASEMGDLARVIRDEVRRLDGLVGDFLLFSRASRVQHQPGDLEAVVDEVVRLLRPEAEAAGVRIDRRHAGEPVSRFHMDTEKMKQVVINLLRNAIEAMPEGGEVTVQSGAVDGQARLVVRDTGSGLPAEVDVFQLFVTTKAQGTGLGLSIVQEIVQQHGGEVVAQDVPEGGACFTVTLPLSGQPQEGVKP